MLNFKSFVFWRFGLPWEKCMLVSQISSFPVTIWCFHERCIKKVTVNKCDSIFFNSSTTVTKYSTKGSLSWLGMISPKYLELLIHEILLEIWNLAFFFPPGNLWCKRFMYCVLRSIEINKKQAIEQITTRQPCRHFPQEQQRLSGSRKLQCQLFWGDLATLVSNHRYFSFYQFFLRETTWRVWFFRLKKFQVLCKI